MQPNCRYSPVTGAQFHEPVGVDALRKDPVYRGGWTVNPWTGSKRAYEDVESDPQCLAVWMAEWGPMRAAPDAARHMTGGTRIIDGQPAPRSPKGSMSTLEFGVVVRETVDSIQKLLAVKGAEYTGARDDRLAAFKRSGDAAGVTPLQCLHIYMAKHIDAVATFIRDDAEGKTRERSEPIEGRLDDIINYCILAKAIIKANR
jgi:hypothetical protein